MNRTFPAMVALFGTSSLLLVDSAIKGFLILLSAAVAAMLLRRDSAATRHLVWLVAIVAMLIIPVFSALLPQWQVLPAWMGMAHESPVMHAPIPGAAMPRRVTAADPVDVLPVASEGPSASSNPPGVVAVESQSEFVASEVFREPADTSWSWIWSSNWNWNAIWKITLPLFWAFGFCLLMLRLLIARWVLCNLERRGTVISLSPHASTAGTAQEAKASSAILAGFQAACRQLGVRQRIRLLIHSERTIPVVWGIVRFRLLLPEAARHWSDEQLRSVLLHELAHVKRHDTVVQLLTQIACALHWFNPLVWFAACRLHVERERACDDLVLSNGIRASAYAEHLLNVATKLTPDRWTSTCGLTMAGSLPLQGRLQAILSDRLNRRKVSTTIGALALLIGASIAIPIAMLRAAADENNAEPKDAISRTLFESWKTSARSDGRIPGGRIGEMAASLKIYMDLNAGSEAAARCEAVFKRCDATHDWTPAEAATLLDEVEAVAPSRAEWAMRTNIERTIHPGKPLPDQLKDAPWGQPAASGLRIAWLLEPRDETQPLDRVLKSRVLFHNTGKAPVCFATEDWIQTGGHQAKDANAKEIRVWSVEREGLRTRMIFRLAPDEYAEVEGHGIGVGSHETSSEKSIYQVGCWIEAKEGDAVTFTPGKVLVSFQTWQNNEGRKDSTTAWNEMIAARVAQEGPWPATVADRELLIQRVTQDLGISLPYHLSNVELPNDNSPDCLAKLTVRLQEAGKSMHFAGELSGGETKFRVTAADPNAAKALCTATGPGRYVLGDGVHLQVTQITAGADSKRTNEATIIFLSPDPKVASPHKPYEIALPDGLLAYAIAWERGAGVLWITQKGLVRKYDFANPAQVKETRLEEPYVEKMPKPIFDALTKALSMAGAPVQQPVSLQQNVALLKPATEQKLKWGDSVNGLRMALAWPPTLGEPGMGDTEEFYLVVQNVSETTVRLAAGDDAPNPRMLYMREGRRILQGIGDNEPTQGSWLLQPREVAFLRLYQSNAKGNDGRTVSSFIEQDIRLTPRFTMTAEMTIEKAPAGAWTGKLKTGETRGSVDVIPPKHKDAQALYQSWTTASRANGDIPGALIGLLAESVKMFIKNNPTWESTPQLEKMLPRFDATRDWSGQDAVALLDELAALQDTPIKMALDREEQGVIRTGSPLPPELADAPWGKTLPNGLRHAWLLEPRAAEHQLGTALKARALIHNAGKEPLVFRTRTWHQLGHKATDAKGAAIKTESTSWTTRGLLLTYRLAPGEFIEVNGPGIGIGPKGNPEDWQQTRVGTWIEAKAGDEVMVTTVPLPLYDWGEEEQLKLDGEPRWWLDYIKARLSRHLPFPADEDARERLLYRVAMELFGTPYNDAAFVADTTPGALDVLALRLFHRPGQQAWAGPLESAPTTFQVLPADPDAAKKPRSASNPGQYTLNENAKLVVTRRPIGERIVNEAAIRFAQPEAEAARPPGPYKFELPDGYDRWAAAWVRGGTVMWVQQKGLLRKLDFSKIAKVEETRYEGEKSAEAPIPADVREAVRAALAVPDAPKQIEKPLPPAATPPPATPAQDEKPKVADVRIKPESLLGFWRGTLNDEAINISFHRPPVATDVQCDIYFGGATIGAPTSFKIAPDGKSVTLATRGKGGGEYGRLTPGKAGTLQLELAGKQAKPGKALLKRDVDEPTGEPQQEEPRALFREWKKSAYADGKIPGALIGKLADEVRKYVKANPNLHSGQQLPKLLPRFDASRDWTPAEAVSLLDDVAYYSTGPIEAILAQPSDALWETKTRFEIMPVQIANWSEAKDGLRIGMRVAEGEWRVGGKVRIELWLHNAGAKDVSFNANPGRADVGLMVAAKDSEGGDHWADGGNISLIAMRLHCTLPAGFVAKVKDFELSFDAPDNKELAWMQPKFRDLKPGQYRLRCTWADAAPMVSGAGDWTGDLTAPELDFTLVALDAPRPKPRVEWANVDVSKEGGISLNRKKVTLDELKARASEHVADWRIIIDADEQSPYAKVAEVADVLHDVGATFSYRDGRMGDAKLRVANLQASFKLDGTHRFSMCRPEEHPQWFTVNWPAEGERPNCWLRTVPNVSDERRGEWAVAWEPGTDVLWWVDDTDIGKMTLTDPARVIVDREGRTNNFSRDFGLPEEVKAEFRRLGFVIGRDKTPGLENAIGGNTGGQSIVSAQVGNWIIKGIVTDADGKPLEGVPVRVRTELAPTLDIATAKTDAKGIYRVAFPLNLTTLAAFRGVWAEPVLEGFTERDLAKSGEFNVLLRAGEEPRRPGDENAPYVGPETPAPGLIPRFAERDLLPSPPGVAPGNPGVADFVMLKAGEIIGEIITSAGKPAPPHWIAVATPEQRPGFNVAIEKSDADGRFRLKGIPPNKPLIFTANLDGKPGETSKSGEVKLEQAGPHKIRIILPADGSGKGPLKVL
ncbi:MAG: M56 family metallopeptidase [Pirellulaceae bacterium]